MYINKANNGRNNICGIQIMKLRKMHNLSQNKLAQALQLQGLNLDKNAIQRIESGQRFLTDIELPFFAKFFNVSIESLYDLDNDFFKE